MAPDYNGIAAIGVGAGLTKGRLLQPARDYPTNLPPQFPQNLPPWVSTPQVGQWAGAALATGLPHSGQNLDEPTSAPHCPQSVLGA